MAPVSALEWGPPLWLQVTWLSMWSHNTPSVGWGLSWWRERRTAEPWTAPVWLAHLKHRRNHTMRKRWSTLQKLLWCIVLCALQGTNLFYLKFRWLMTQLRGAQTGASDKAQPQYCHLYFKVNQSVDVWNSILQSPQGQNTLDKKKHLEQGKYLPLLISSSVAKTCSYLLILWSTKLQLSLCSNTCLFHISWEFGLQKICHFFVFFILPVKIGKIDIKYMEIHEYKKHVDNN